jgi:16S rRNA (guanine527-N7)-methyltransferase
MLKRLADDARAYGVKLDSDAIERFERYLTVLTDWSQRMNLVGDASPDVVERRHFGESLALGAALREREVLRPGSDVLDVGAGAGFPGVPLKIAWPAIRLTLLEATAKKAAFLEALRDALGLEFDVVTGRAETLAHEEALRGRFDLVLARAVAALPELLELTLPFARPGGRVVTVKGSRVEAEVAAAAGAAATLGGRIFTMQLRVEGPDQSIVAVVKTGETPPEYPRAPGVPHKRPL